MNTAPKKSEVKCPHCGNRFSPEAAIEHEIRQQVERELTEKLSQHSKALEQRVQRMEEDKYRAKLKSIEADRESKVARLNELEKRSLEFEERERMLDDREEKAELEMRRRLLERERVLNEAAERKATEKANLHLLEKQQALERDRELLDIEMNKRVNEAKEKIRQEEQLKLAEVQKKLDDQSHMVNEMKRKVEQGSMQMQGEVQELAIEDFLKNNFRRDRIEEVAKGKRGGDCVHSVLDAWGNTCGKILYESKRTKNFGTDWTSKLKEDMRLTQADIGVIVTEVLPDNMTRFGQYDGVWVCTFTEFKALSALFRESLCRVGEVRIAQENKGGKMQMLYEYLTSIEFRQKLEAIVESFQMMQEDLSKEKAQAVSRWAKREKQIFKVLENTVALYGDVRGIAGNAIREIDALEVGEVRMLVEK